MTSFGFIVTVTVIINILVFAGIDFILCVLRVPPFTTVISQAVSGLGIGVYVWVKEKELRPEAKEVILSKTMTLEVVHNSAAVMAAFAVAEGWKE